MALSLPRPSLSETTLLLRSWQEQDFEVVRAAGLDTLISRYRSRFRGPLMQHAHGLP
jgi:hypothetical protein